MKIAHVGLATFYTEGLTYQDNQLAEQNVADGHEVLFISNAAKYVDGEIVETGYEDTVCSDGVRLIRLPYVKIFNKFISDKIRKVKGIYGLLVDFAPDVIMVHGLSFWSVKEVIRYKKDYPQVKLYADTHTAADNSGRSWISLNVLHKGLYRYLTQEALPNLEKYFYIGEDERLFAVKNYGVPEAMMEFYPLGGQLPSEADAKRYREVRRRELNIAEDELLLVHAGKLEPKKKTEMLLRAFAAVPKLKAKLAVVGSIPEKQKTDLIKQMDADPRVVYLGWKSGAELHEYLCACDLYIQPGKVSALMQNAVCCGAPVLAYPHETYIKRYDYGNCIWAATEEELILALQGVAEGKYNLPGMRDRSSVCAQELLDYRTLAARLYI